MKRFSLSTLLLILSVSITWTQQENTDFTKPQPEALEKWRDMRFGLFVHWGPSVNDQSSGWSRGLSISIEEYDQLYTIFNPVQFDADTWAQTAKSAGVKYLVLITKHHDGFCMWPSEQNDYNISATPFKRDVVGELSEACREQGIRFGTYYSVADWYHPDFWNRSPGGSVSNPNADREGYMNYLHAQVAELIENYGPLCSMWFDVPRGIEREHAREAVRVVRQLQPDIMINNRIGGGYGDHRTSEQHIGDYNRDSPWESCMTMTSTWHWKDKYDDALKPANECLQMLMYTVGGDGNLLLNTGPMPDGRIEPRQIDVLRGIGDWLGRYGECIYETRGGPYKPSLWGASTCNGKDLYLMVMIWDRDNSLTLPSLPYKIVKKSVLTGGEVNILQTGDGLKLTIGRDDIAYPATVIKLRLDGEVFDIEPMEVPEIYDAVSTRKPVKASSEQVKGPRHRPVHAVDGYPATLWKSRSDDPPWIEVDLEDKKAIRRAMIMEEKKGVKRYDPVKSFQLQVKSGEEWIPIYKGTEIGDNLELNFKPTSGRYFRLLFTESRGSAAIREFQLFE